MARRIRRLGAVLACGLVANGALSPASAWGQTRERDVTVTGPRGRTIERKLQSTVTPGGLDRQTTVVRPGGTFTRDVHIARPVAPVMPMPPMRGWVPGPPRGVFVERDVIVAPRGGVSGAQAFGIGALGAAVGTGAGFLLGRAMSPPPPPVVVGAPVVVAPAPIVAGPPVVVAGPPVLAAPATVYQPQPVVVHPQGPDQVTLAIGRLASWHENSRKEACYVLGRLGDPRAIPALVDALKTDKSTSVRVAAATAIGQIGDPSACVYMERVITYDKKQEVRDAAAASLASLRSRVVVPAPTQAARPTQQPQAQAYPPPAVTRPAASPTDFQPLDREHVPPPPTPILPPADTRPS